MRKGIILAGGSGSRLHPLTLSVSKQLMPVYDKPMIYYPLSTLMLAGIYDILIITTPYDIDVFKKVLGDGSQWGISLKYETQPSPDGLAQAFLIGKDFIGKDCVTLVLGDNIFYGEGLSERLRVIGQQEIGATVFGYFVKDPERYGVIEFDNTGQVISIEEKPQTPKSNYAVTGLYFYDNDIVDIVKNIRPSQRGELEITDVNKVYLKEKKLTVELLKRGTAWLDTGTHESLFDAATFIKVIEDRQGLKVSCLEEIAFERNLINIDQLEKMAHALKKNNYGQYLEALVKRVSAK